MLRKLSLVLFACLVLAGCGRAGRGMYLTMPNEVALPEQDKAQIFSYSHALALAMDRGAVRARFERARGRCLRDAALRCKLLSASASDFSGSTSARLEIALPHDAIAAYEAGLLKPLAEDKGGVEVNSRTTVAQSIENQADDTSKRVAQLTRYRDGLAELAKRPNLGVDDFIKVQGELAKTEADLDAALSEKRDIESRIARERVSINLAERAVASSPIGEVLASAGDQLVYSTADMLRVLIVLAPWLPVIVVLFFPVRWLLRIARRRPAVADSEPASNGG